MAAGAGWIRYTVFGSDAARRRQLLVKSLLERGVDNRCGRQFSRQRLDLEQEVRRALQVFRGLCIHRPHGHVGLAQPVTRNVLIEIGLLRPQIGIFVGVVVDPGPRLFQADQEVGDGFALAVDRRCRGSDGTEAWHEVLGGENRSRTREQNLLGMYGSHTGNASMLP